MTSRLAEDLDENAESVAMRSHNINPAKPPEPSLINTVSWRIRRRREDRSMEEMFLGRVAAPQSAWRVLLGCL